MRQHAGLPAGHSPCLLAQTFFTALFLQETFLCFPCSLSSASLALQDNLNLIRTGNIHRHQQTALCVLTRIVRIVRIEIV